MEDVAFMQLEDKSWYCHKGIHTKKYSVEITCVNADRYTAEFTLTIATEYDKRVYNFDIEEDHFRENGFEDFQLTPA